MAVDDSFKKPGAVPFKWEIRPGVPKLQQQQKPQEQSPQKQKQLRPKPKPKQPPPPLPPPVSPFTNQRSSPSPVRAPPAPLQRKLKPPPAGSYFFLTSEPRSLSFSFKSNPCTRSDSWRFDQPARVRSECVSPGCFPAPLLRRKGNKRKTQKPEPDYVSDLETVFRWSLSSRRSLSPFYSSPASSFSSFRSSPRPVAGSEWAGFGLF